MTITRVGMRTRWGIPGGRRQKFLGSCLTALLFAGLAPLANAQSQVLPAASAVMGQVFGQVQVQLRNAKKVPPKQADQVEPAAGDDAKPVADPFAQPVLGPLLRQLFNPGAPPQRARPDGATGEDGRGRDRDSIDSRAPHDLKVEQVMRAAETAIQRNEWKTGQDLLQRLLDLPEDSLYRRGNGRWQSVRQMANEMLGKAPRQVLEDYRTQYAGLAQQLLTEARRSGRTADYVSVATRFLHTPAGYEAANYLGSLHLDRGEFGLAAAWFDDIAKSSAPFSADGPWRMKAALASRQAGNTAGSQKLLDSFGEPPRQVSLGMGNVEPSTWLGGTTAAFPNRSRVLADWTQLYGSAARLGTATGSEPLLSPLWSLPLTSSHTVRRKLTWIMQDLLDQGRVPLLAAAPLVAGGRMVYRDLRGVRAVDIETGKTIWESIEGVSPERILGGLPGQFSDGRDAWRMRMQAQNDFNEYQGQSAEYHPLASLLFRDGIYGVISSDGQQVFVIEDHGILSRNQPGQQWGWDGNGEQHDPYGVPWRTNRLVSYDLKSGRPRWSLGGIEAQESFDLPLAGSYFYGTPTVDGEELLVVAGKGDDVRLWCLDRATGTPRWSQLIAYTDTKIDQDIGRRWFTAQVATDGGVIVCPTTVGWLVAVDRLRQSVLWAHRYLPPSESNERESSLQFVPQRELSAQWAPSAPVISGRTVVYTPPEEPTIVALNLLDGRRLWDKAKEEWLYLAGVFDDKVVLVGTSQVGAFHLTTGKSAWSKSLESHPSGRGQAVDDQYYLPLSNGELQILDLKDGTMAAHGFVPRSHPPLGNLAMHRGKLVALGPQGPVGFGQRDAVLAEIQRRKLQDPHDPWALLREAEVHLLNRDYVSALPLLTASQGEGLSKDEQQRRHSELIDCLAAVIRQNPQAHHQELQELGTLAETANEKRLHLELKADLLVTQSRYLEAFDILWSMKESGDPDVTIPRGDDPQVQLSATVWLSGRLMELWLAASETDRDNVDAHIAAIVAGAKDADTATRRHVASILGFHPSAVPLRESLIEDLASAGEFGGAQMELLKLASSTDRIVAGRATLRLARLMEQFQMPADAGYYYKALQTQFADVVVANESTGAQLVQQLQSDGKIVSETKPSVPAWDERPLELMQGTIQYMPPAQEISLYSRLPFFESLDVEVRPQEQRLGLEFVENGQYSWLAPLRSSPRNQGDGYAATEFLGHEIVLINRDVLHVMSPVEKKLMWSTYLDAAGEGGPFWRHASRPPYLAMLQARNFDQQSTMLQQAAHTGRLAVVQPGYLCVYGRRSISILDPRTGEFLWSKEGIPQYSQVVGNRDMVCVIPPNQAKAEAYRASDGKLLTIDRLGPLLASTLQLREDSLLLLEQGSPSRYSLLNLFTPAVGKTVLRLYQPLANKNHWQAEFPANSLVSTVDANTVLVVPADGKAVRVDIATGERLPLEAIPLSELKSRRSDLYALADDDHIYLMANVLDNSGFHHYGESLPSVRANGVCYAWNRSDGKLAWQQEVKNQNLVIDRFRTMPIMLFVARSWQQRGNMSFGTLSIQAIHKKTGKVLHNTPSMPSMYSGFHSLEVNRSEPSVELRSYNLRMRLAPTDGPVAEVKPPEKPESKN